MSQAALTLGVTLFCPSVHGGHYIPIPRFENTTLSPGLHLDLYYMDVRLSLLLLAGSLVALCFSFSTHSLQEQNVLHADYSADAMDQVFLVFFSVYLCIIQLTKKTGRCVGPALLGLLCLIARVHNIAPYNPH